MFCLMDNVIADICDKSCFVLVGCGVRFFFSPNWNLFLSQDEAGDVEANSLESPFESHPRRRGNEMWHMLKM